MKNYLVVKDRNEDAEELGSGFETLEIALDFAKEEIMNTDPTNDSEGINIYSEVGMEITMCKEDDNSFSYAKLNPATSMQVGNTIIINV